LMAFDFSGETEAYGQYGVAMDGVIYTYETLEKMEDTVLVNYDGLMVPTKMRGFGDYLDDVEVDGKRTSGSVMEGMYLMPYLEHMVSTHTDYVRAAVEEAERWQEQEWLEAERVRAEAEAAREAEYQRAVQWVMWNEEQKRKAEMSREVVNVMERTVTRRAEEFVKEAREVREGRDIVCVSASVSLSSPSLPQRDRVGVDAVVPSVMESMSGKKLSVRKCYLHPTGSVAQASCTMESTQVKASATAALSPNELRARLEGYGKGAASGSGKKLCLGDVAVMKKARAADQKMRRVARGRSAGAAEKERNLLRADELEKVAVRLRKGSGLTAKDVEMRKLWDAETPGWREWEGPMSEIRSRNCLPGAESSLPECIRNPEMTKAGVALPAKLLEVRERLMGNGEMAWASVLGLVPMRAFSESQLEIIRNEVFMWCPSHMKLPDDRCWSELNKALYAVTGLSKGQACEVGEDAMVGMVAMHVDPEYRVSREECREKVKALGVRLAFISSRATMDLPHEDGFVVMGLEDFVFGL
jgi:hypothetical protein